VRVREREGGREGGKERERDLLGIIQNGRSGAAPAHGGGSRIKVSHVCLRL
jgi:hypothetical protein